MRFDIDARTPASAALQGPIERHQPEARKDRWMLELERAAMADGGKSAPRAAAAPTAPRDDAQSPATHSAAQDLARRQPAPHAPAQEGAWQWVAPAQAQPGVSAPVAGVAPATAAPSAPFRPGSLLQQSGPALAAPLWSTPAVLSLPAAVSLARLAGAMDVTQDGPALGAAPAVPVAPPVGENYARSLLHVYCGADGVHAWLRDASLSQAQVRKVAQGLASELAVSGAPLAALTVNGKKIMSSGVAGDQGGRDAPAVHDEVAPVALPLSQFAVKGA